MDLLKELKELQAKAEASNDGESFRKINNIIIEQIRPVTRREVICLIDEKLKEALGEGQ